MDKNNDIQVNKVDKWDAAPVSTKNLRNYILESWKNHAVPRYCPPLDPLVMMQLLEPVLDDYNELEAKHNADCGLISKLEEDVHDLEVRVKSQIDKLETKHAKATRFIARLTEALNEAGVSFHYVKFGGDGEEIFYIDSLVDRMAKKHYEEQSFRLRNTVRNYGEQIRCFKNDISELKAKIYKLEKDKECSEFRNDLLLKALNQAGIRPSFDIRANKWIIQYTDKAENAFLAADQIKRNAEKRVEAADNKIKELEKKLKSAEDCFEVYRDSYERTVNDVCKLQEFLEKCGVPVKYRNDDTWYWDFENSAWDDTLMKDCKLIDKCRELEKENKEFKEILAFCERDANMARNLCHNIAFNAERTRNNKN